MSAEILRRAAKLMRERAEDCISTTDPTEEPWYVVRDEGIRTKWHSFAAANATDATHIASWHPAVALAVADWLDADATIIERHDLNAAISKAYAVARTYLGEQS